MKYILIENNVIATHDDNQDVTGLYAQNAYEYVTDDILPQDEYGRYLPLDEELTSKIKSNYFSPERNRQRVYLTDKLIEYKGELITVNECNELLKYYIGEPEADELIAKKIVAREKIRNRYPE